MRCSLPSEAYKRTVGLVCAMKKVHFKGLLTNRQVNYFSYSRIICPATCLIDKQTKERRNERSVWQQNAKIRQHTQPATGHNPGIVQSGQPPSTSLLLNASQCLCPISFSTMKTLAYQLQGTAFETSKQETMTRCQFRNITRNKKFGKCCGTRDD